MQKKIILVTTTLILAALLLLPGVFASPNLTNFTDALHVRCSICATATTVLEVYQNSGTGGGKVAEIGALSTPFIEVYRPGGVRVYGPTAMATSVPALEIENDGVGDALVILNSSGTPVYSVDGNGNTSSNASQFLRYQDVAQAPSIRAIATSIATTTTSLTTSILGIETPRNAVLLYDSNGITATAGTITLTGVDARGNATTEDLTVAAQTANQTLTGNVAWSSISQIDLQSSRTEVISLTVTGGQKFGLPLIPSDLYHLTVNATPQTAPTVNSTYGTFDPVSTPASNVDYNVWVK